MLRLHDQPECWRLLPDVAPQEYEALIAVLSVDERARAARIADPARRVLWQTLWGKARVRLAACVGMEPQTLAIERSAHGKPFIPDFPLHFNLSHSGSVCLLAVSRDGPVGVDVERCRDDANLERLARRCLAEQEHAAWLSQPPEQRVGAFFRWWALKEALLKADGRGIGLGMSRCVVDIAPEVRVQALPQEMGAPRDWQVKMLDVEEGYQAALAWRRAG